jgi:ABC-type transporter Mla subunit MlaD
MLGQADDLMIAYVQKTQTGEIPLADAAQRGPYILAFTAALDDYNQTIPPTPSILNHAWKTVSEVTQQFLNVYQAVDQGQAVSSRDLSSMRTLRQLVKNYQDYAEGYLRAKGKGADFFASEHEAVDAHFQKSYGDQSVPALSSAPYSVPPTAGVTPTLGQ